MDRQQKINKIKNEGRVNKVADLQVNQTRIHPDYTWLRGNCILSDTGQLEVLKVVRKSGDGPYFIARWDQRPQSLDIDMFGATESENRDFKAGKGGYSGHHPSQTANQNGRCFDVFIQTPLATIFEGTVCLSNEFLLPTAAGNYGTVISEAGLIPAGSKTEGA